MSPLPASSGDIRCMGSPSGSRALSRQVVKRPASRRGARVRDCWQAAMRSTAKSSWELLGGAVEAFAEDEIAILGAGDFDVAIAGEFRGHQMHGLALGVEGFVGAGGEWAGFEAGGADEGLLAGGDALDGEEFLGVDGAVEVERILAELVDFVEVFEANDGEGVAGEAVFAGVEGGFHLTGGGTGAGGFLRVDAVGGDLFVGGPGGLPFNSEVAWRLEGNGGREREVV